MKIKMEPGTVTSSSSPEKSRRPPPTDSYLHVDPSTYYRSNEELPENFLETISPQQATPGGGMMNDHAGSPQLAPLAPMSMANSDSGYLSMGMGSQYSSHSSLEKTSFGNGPAGLLSPLHLDGRRTHTRGHYATPDGYIKEEDPLDPGQHLLIAQPMSSQHELDRLDSNETPPAVSNVELASTMIATLIGEQRGSSPSPHSYSQPSSSVMHQRVNNIKHDSEDSMEGHSHLNGDDRDSDYQRQSYAKQNHRRVYSTKDTNDPLNAELEDDIYIDTKELCKRIAYELKQHSIPQAIFAERILCRSQGTLSDLLRNPKPWNKLKSGRETFRRMFNWVQQPLSMRLGILDMCKHGSDGEEPHSNGGIVVKTIGMTPPTPAQNVRHGTRRSMGDDGAPSAKRPRLVFTDIQKRTLQAIFRETQRPSREMQQTIAEHLRLDLSTVANFFMNARRRSRIGANTDEPQPYQQVRPVTPPPDSPPRTTVGSRRRVPASMQHVEATVSSVADSAIQYSRDGGHDQLDDDDYKMYKDPMGDGLRGHYEAVDVVHCESMTPLGDSPVDVVDRGMIKQEEDLEDDSPIAP